MAGKANSLTQHVFGAQMQSVVQLHRYAPKKRIQNHTNPTYLNQLSQNLLPPVSIEVMRFATKITTHYVELSY